MKRMLSGFADNNYAKPKKTREVSFEVPISNMACDKGRVIKVQPREPTTLMVMSVATFVYWLVMKVVT